MWPFFWLIPLGLFLGAYGTLIGAGGGFMLMPILLLLYPSENPEILASISLAVVFFNALSGSIAYARMRRIDYKSGVVFSAATIPGAVLGALTTAYLPRRLFDGVMGVLLIGVAGTLLCRRSAGHAGANIKGTYELTRTLLDADGTRHTFSYNPLVGVAISLVAGFVSSLLGIGGGIIHVPALVYILHFPVHIATATSHFVLVAMACAGTIVHIVMGAFSRGIRRTIALAIGVLLGAQAGARLSNRLQGGWIIRGLAAALGFIGVRILLQAFLSR